MVLNGVLIYEIDVGVGHRLLHLEAPGKRNVEEKYGDIGWQTPFWSNIKGALGENVIFGLSVRVVLV